MNMENFFENIVSHIGIADILDILIVAFLVYKLLGFIRETRAEQLAKGLLVLAVSTVVAKWCHFYTLHWLLSGLLSVGLIAIIVIFQPELRRLLENLGRSRFDSVLWEFDREEASKIVEGIVSAAGDMSKTKTGALIVVERDTTLTDIVETGTIVDANISTQLIENVFYEGSPLHDGALLIRGNRLHAAGCVLPLTENKKLSKELGTRHRAGIGITETSDAFVIIVSEETGIISVCENGKIKRPVAPEQLKSMLMSLYFQEDSKKKLHDRLTKSMKSGKSGGEKNA